MTKNREIALNAMIAAAYFVLTSLTIPISFLEIQFRIAEILVLFCFFNPKYVLGVTLGCFLANINSPLGVFDLVFGTLATLISALCIAYSKRLLFAAIYPVLVNGLIVGLMLMLIYEVPFFIAFLGVALGELVVMMVGYLLLMILKRNQRFLELIAASKNQNFKF